MIKSSGEEYRRDSGKEPVFILKTGEEVLMAKITLKVEKEFCDECSLALRRFIGHMEGVESIDVEDGRIAIAFDNSKITGEELLKITKDSMEKLGYKLLE